MFDKFRRKVKTVLKVEPKVVSRNVTPNAIILKYEDGSERKIYVTSGGWKSELCKDGWKRVVYVPRYPPEQRMCVDCHYYDCYGPPADDDRIRQDIMFATCFYLQGAKAHRIPQKIFEEGGCPHFTLRGLTRDFDRHKMNDGAFVKQWRKKEDA